jgi:WD40 repeat protein
MNSLNINMFPCFALANLVFTLAAQAYAHAHAHAHAHVLTRVCANDRYLWQGGEDKKPIAPRMVGHQKGVIYASFSPDGRTIASSSFDKSVKIWNGATGARLSRPPPPHTHTHTPTLHTHTHTHTHTPPHPTIIFTC